MCQKYGRGNKKVEILDKLKHIDKIEDIVVKH